MKFELVCVSDDARGKVYVLKKDSEELGLITLTYQGKARGGHSHPYRESYRCVSGAALVVWINDYGLSDSTNSTLLRKGDALDLDVQSAHFLIALEDTILFEMRDSKDYKAFDVIPYKAWVEVFNGK